MNCITSYPLVSVIIPTYNRERSVGKAIESVLNQTYPNIQLIVIDDGSIDGTQALVSKYPGIEYELQEHKSQGRARNTGLKRAHGSYIASLDSDDTWNRDFLECCVAELEENNLDFVFANWLQAINNDHGFDFLSRFVALRKYKRHETGMWVPLPHEELKDLYLNSCPSPSSSLVIRRSSIRKGWNEDMNIADDWSLLLDIVLEKNSKAAFNMQRLWVKRTDGTNIYDGRNASELRRLLYTMDFDLMIKLYSDRMTKGELKKFQQLRIAFFYREALIGFIKRHDTIENFRIFKQALAISPLQLLPIVCISIVKKITNLVKEKLVKAKKSKVGSNDLEFIAIPE